MLNIEHWEDYQKKDFHFNSSKKVVKIILSSPKSEIYKKKFREESHK